MKDCTRKNSDLPLDLAEFLGWHVGDGCISINERYSEYSLTGDITEEYPFYKSIITPTFNTLFKHNLKKPIKLKKYASVGVCGIYVFDKKFVSNLQKKFSLISGKKIDIQVPANLNTKIRRNGFSAVYSIQTAVFIFAEVMQKQRRDHYAIYFITSQRLNWQLFPKFSLIKYIKC
jgi:hypothetical protein